MEKKEYVLNEPLPEEAPAILKPAHDTWLKKMDDSIDASCLMLATMIPDLQKDLENHSAYDMINQLKEIFQQLARTERFETVRAFHACKMEDGQTVSSYVLKMKSHIDHLARLGVVMPEELATDMILNSLTKSFDPFVMNYNMNGLNKTIPELHGMLITAEKNLPKKTTQVLMIKEGGTKRTRPEHPTNSKGKGKAKVVKGKGKKVVQPSRPPKKKAKVAKEDACFECGKVGHWKRNCPTYLTELKKKKAGEGTSGIYVIDLELYNLSPNTWVFDTGCGTHICNMLQGFKRSRRLKANEVVLRVGNSARVAVDSIGSFDLLLPSGLYLTLLNVYYVPSLTRNIISVAKLRQYGFNLCFINDDICVSKNNVFYFEARPLNGIYEVNLDEKTNHGSLYHTFTKRPKCDLSQTYLWHCRLGHINKKRISQLQKSGLLKANENDSFDICESCLHGKMTKAPFSGTNERAKDLLGIIHTDVCGPFKPMTRYGERYFITFTDDFSRFGYVYLIKHKHEAFEMFKMFQSEVENQLNKAIKVLRSDRGGEYLTTNFMDHLKSCGIVSELTPPGTPQHNGVSERRNRTLLDMVRSMMSRSTLPLSFWGYALQTAARLLNMAPTKKNKIFISRKAEFLENKFLTEEASGRFVELEELQEPHADTQEVGSSIQQGIVEPEQTIDQEQIVTQDVRRSGRVRFEPERYGYLMMEEECYTIDSDEPVNYQSAMSDPESDKWLEAMNTEMQSMHDNQVWDLVNLPTNCKTVGNKWVFKKKTDVDGNVHTFKARLVAKGYSQTHGIDYDETFSPVAMIKSIRILFAIAAYYDYEIWQMDVRTAFLNGHLLEDVYMDQPEGFVDPKHPNKVCKLKRSIYGLKQVSRTWNIRFDEKITNFGFIKNEDDSCVYKKASGSIVIFLVLYVDDILLFGNDIPTLKGVKAFLENCFSMKDLGEAAYVLGIKIYRDRSKRLIGLSQSVYIDKILKRFKMQDSKRGFLPITHGTILSKSQCPSTRTELERMKHVPYALAIGSIMYAMLCTRPDVSYALSMTSRYQQNPGEAHWTAVKNILKYLRKTKDMFLVYGGLEESLKVKGYTNASFQTDRDDSRSQSGYVFILNGGAVSWKSSKQEVIAQSTTESEYVAASEAAQEAVWMRKFIEDLGVVPSIRDPIELFCDNLGAIAQAKEPRSHQKTKHIHRRYNYIRHEVKNGEISIHKVHTDQNLADPFTKPLP
ncbi:hypothetical protein L2E82_38397 [Cichorium intybus]|uniref:Uncharacterized protein n=1 Tax=Cichorium intybus TaxID=13427 RepID=A0ACB9AGA2_CICIN|nr:hypothetical protein L2E82_38397 [Cichorium intybus]